MEQKITKRKKSEVRREFLKLKLNGLTYTECQKDIENVKTKELKKLCKLIKETIYPFLDFKVHYTGKYDTKKFLDLLTHVAMNHDFTHNGSQTFRFVMKENTPASNTLLYHIRKSDSEEIRH